MLFRALPFPPCALHEPVDELILASSEVHHSALRVAHQRDAPDAANRDGIRDLELAVTQIRTPRPYDERKIIGDIEVLAVVHAHADEQIGIRIRGERLPKIMVFQETADR